jgi:hypothetical protein
MGIREMKSLVKKKISKESNTSGLDKVEERISGLENKVDELLYSDNNKRKKSSHNHNNQDLWDMINIKTINL